MQCLCTVVREENVKRSVSVGRLWVRNKHGAREMSSFLQAREELGPAPNGQIT